MAAKLHFAENTLALHLLLQRLEGLIDVVVADENLQRMFLLAESSDPAEAGCGLIVVQGAERAETGPSSRARQYQKRGQESTDPGPAHSGAGSHVLAAGVTFVWLAFAADRGKS